MDSANSKPEPSQAGNPSSVSVLSGGKLSELRAPAFVAHRLKVWDDFKARQPAPVIPKRAIVISLPDGRKIEAEAGVTSPADIAAQISKELAASAVVARVGSELWDLKRPLEADCALEILSFDSEDGKKVFWHSGAHLLGQAMELLYGCLLCVGPPLVEGGFYYDAAMVQPVSSDDYASLQALVDQSIAARVPFERLLLPKDVALEMFKFNKYKVEIIRSKIPDGGVASAYRCGSLIDLCKGPHVPHAGKIAAFSVVKNGSAYWLGKAENDSLQRVYGIAFPSRAQQDAWFKFQADAAERDHRNIGRKQELFFFHPFSPGSCFFLPHGARIYNKLMELIRSEYRSRGFTEVVSPNIYNKALWELSGHWEKYREHMFAFEADGGIFGLKPMNCPGHCLMFQHRARSYRELPIRFADFGVLHRNEMAGALTGLTRVRRFQQDDAHIFCRQDQIRDEIRGALDFMSHIYNIFGFDFSLELSTRPANFMGEPAVWDAAEKALADALNDFKRPWKINPGDGAFYGPKIDIHVFDAFKRAHQCATIQLDFQLPLRLKLEYAAAGEGERQTPVIIHRAILGSIERLIAVLAEHTAGKWPLWLSPRQIAVLPVAEAYLDYAKSVVAQLHAAGFYVDLDASDSSLSKKIREAQIAQYNFVVVVGDQEARAGTVAARARGEQAARVVPRAQFIQELQNQVAGYK